MTSLESILTSSKPLWLLDVDGVVNCWPAPSFGQLMASQDWADVNVGRVKVWWSRSVVQFIREVVEAESADILWLTTWDSDSIATLSRAMNLPVLAHIADQSGTTEPGLNWWKLNRVREIVSVISADRRVVWTDDHLHEALRPEAIGLLGPRGLLVTPESNPGLTMNHISQINTFLRSKDE